MYICQSPADNDAIRRPGLRAPVFAAACLRQPRRPARGASTDRRAFGRTESQHRWREPVQVGVQAFRRIEPFSRAGVPWNSSPETNGVGRLMDPSAGQPAQLAPCLDRASPRRAQADSDDSSRRARLVASLQGRDRRAREGRVPIRRQPPIPLKIGCFGPARIRRRRHDRPPFATSSCDACLGANPSLAM